MNLIIAIMILAIIYFGISIKYTDKKGKPHYKNNFSFKFYDKMPQK